MGGASISITMRREAAGLRRAVDHVAQTTELPAGGSVANRATRLPTGD